MESTVRNEARRSTIGSPLDSEVPSSTRNLVISFQLRLKILVDQI